MRLRWSIDVDDDGRNAGRSWSLVLGLCLAVLLVLVIALDVWLIKTIL